MVQISEVLVVFLAPFWMVIVQHMLHASVVPNMASQSLQFTMKMPLKHQIPVNASLQSLCIICFVFALATLLAFIFGSAIK